MAFWDRYRDADRLEEAALGFGPDEAAQARSLSPLGLAAAAGVVILVLMLFSAGPGLRLTETASAYADDEIAAQRIADITTERRLAEARGWDWRQGEVIDAHVSSFQARTPAR